MFLQNHIPPLSENQRNYNTALKKLLKHDKDNKGTMAILKKEIDELNVVWAQEEEKTQLM